MNESETEDLLKTTGNYLAESESLAQGLIQMKRCTDANKERPSNGKLTSVQFHKTYQMMLAAGMDQTLNLFQVDGKTNPKIHSVFLDSFPIYTAKFSADGNQVIMGSRHKSFYYYDLIADKVLRVPKLDKQMDREGTKHFEISPDGKLLAFRGTNGQIHLVSAVSKQLVTTLTMNGSVEALSFNRDGSRLFSVGTDGEIYVWDMTERRCEHKFSVADEGCIGGTAIAVSDNSQYIACGSSSGVVNIYDDSCLQSSRPKPLKVVKNLTTPCTDMTFNPQTEILAVSTHYTEKAVKLVHLPSLTVFSNFPGYDSLKIPKCMDFSTRSGYFTLGNNKGQALLYRVKHYENY